MRRLSPRWRAHLELLVTPVMHLLSCTVSLRTRSFTERTRGCLTISSRRSMSSCMNISRPTLLQVRTPWPPSSKGNHVLNPLWHIKSKSSSSARRTSISKTRSSLMRSFKTKRTSTKMSLWSSSYLVTRIPRRLSSRARFRRQTVGSRRRRSFSQYQISDRLALFRIMFIGLSCLMNWSHLHGCTTASTPTSMR